MKISRRHTLGLLASGIGAQAFFSGHSKAASSDGEKLGLLVVLHGSPRSQWNERGLALGEKVAEMAKEAGIFQQTRTVFMEFAQPTIADGIEDLQNAGCQRIVAVPAFVTVGHHTLFDVPAALGVYYSEHSVAHLAEHGSKPAQPNVPVIYTATLDEGQLLEEFSLAEIEEHSQDADKEAVVFLIHGDAEVRPLLERRLRKIMNFCCAKTGISYADYAYVGVGQGFEHHGVPVILEAAEQRDRVIVVGLYLALSAKAMYESVKGRSPRVEERLAGHEVVFSGRALCDFPPTIDHILHIAHHAAGLCTRHCH